jgi:hypothetical protein
VKDVTLQRIGIHVEAEEPWQHVNAAIAYNIHQYYQCTGDLEFISFYGAEMFLEIARFWSSMTRYNRKLDRLKEFDWEGYRRKYDDIQRLDRVLEAEDDIRINDVTV